MPRTQGYIFIAPQIAVSEGVEELRQKGCDFVILLSTLSENEEHDLVDNVSGIDILVSYNIVTDSQSDAQIGPVFKRGSAIILRPSWQGRRLNKVTFALEDKRIIDFSPEELRLSKEIADDQQIKEFLPKCFSDSDCRKEGLVGQCQNPGSSGATCTFSKPTPIALSIITTKSCVTCNTEKALRVLKQWIPGLTVSYLYYPEKEAQNLIRNFRIEALPVYLLAKEIEKEKVFAQLRLDKNSEKKGNFYMLKPHFAGLTYLLNRKTIKGKLDVFISLYDRQAAELLDAVREFNPRVHFLAKEEGNSFEAATGKFEVEEYLRAVCVEKYYPQAFWDFIQCRAQNSDSSWWEDCVFGLDAPKIKKCSQGAEGRVLLQENTALNKELEIMFGPTYLLHNQEIFASQGVPSREELKKIIEK
jgi:hypothetical protein